MKWSTVRINSSIWYKWQKYVVVSIENPPEITLRRERDNFDIYVNYTELMTDESNKAHIGPMEESQKGGKKIELMLDILTEDEQKLVKERKEIISPILVLEKAKSGDLKSKIEFMGQKEYSHYLKDNETVETLIQERLIERISTEKGICTRHIKRLFYSYRRAERVKNGWGEEGLIPSAKQLRSHRRDEIPLVIHHPKFTDMELDTLYIRQDAKYIQILQQAIEKEYLNLRKVSDIQLFRYARSLCKQKGIPSLGYTTIRHILKSIDPKVIATMREGKKAAAKYTNVELGFTNQEAMYPLHIVAIDHKLLDIITIDEETGCTYPRIWITIGIDLYSREIWCMYLSFEQLSAHRVIKALTHGVLFKDTKGITKNNWDICGKPTIIQLDNGKDFRSLEVKRAINEVLGSQVRFRPPLTPRYGGAIERFFRTFDTKLIHILRGTTKGSIVEKGEYDSEKDAILTVQNLKIVITQFIVDIYHRDKHKGLPLDSDIPALRYYEGLKISGYPEVPEDEEKFVLELLFQDMKAYTKEGIRHNNVLYKANELSGLIRDADKKYKIKYDIDNISKIYIQLPNSAEYAEVPAVKPPADTLKNKNLYIYEMGRKWLKENGRIKKGQIPGAEQIEGAWAELHEEIAKMYGKNIGVRRQAKRAGFGVIPNLSQEKIKPNSEPTLLDRLDEAIKNEE